MDEYTRRTRAWLDGIFAGPADGTYVPHSPIHGFDARSAYLGTYCHVFAVLMEMARYEFTTCLEVGPGEGFLGGLIHSVFGASVAAVDLSGYASRSARDAFGLKTAVGEARALPFKDGCVDLVVSINTLEHVPNVASAVAELMRVARGVVIIGMPHAARAEEREHIDTTEPHAHVSVLTRPEMRAVFGPAAQIHGSLSQLIRPLYALAASDDVAAKPRYAQLNRFPLQPLYRAARWIGRHADARSLVRTLCRLDRAASRALPEYTYESIIVSELSTARRRAMPLSAETILDSLLR